MALKIKHKLDRPLPASLSHLVQIMPPMAIRDDVHHNNVIEMIDRLMRVAKLSKGQSNYLETVVELVEVYESRAHPIDASGITGRRMLKYILEQSAMSGSDLARLLGMHPTMGSKIINGSRKLTWENAKALGTHFKVAPALFMD